MNDAYRRDTRSIRFLAVGDVMLGDHPVCFGHGVRSTIEQRGFSFIFEHVKKIQLEPDLMFGNLETVLAPDMGTSGLYDLEMKGKTEYAHELSEVGFNVMSVANNHAMQHGIDAFRHTVSELKKSGIHPVGVVDNQKSNCFSFEKCGIKIAVIGYSFRPEKYDNGNIPYAVGQASKLLEHVGELRSHYSHVIVSIHWGEEYIHYPSVEQVKLAKRIIDAGASLIIGHHPHVLQGVEEYNNGIIVYSLGNYIFDHWQRETRETIIFDCQFGKDRVQCFKVIPVYINKNYQPVIQTGKEGERIEKLIKKYSSAIGPMNYAVDSDALNKMYQEKARKAYAKYRMESYLYFLKNIYKYKLSVLMDSLLRFLKRRVDPTHP